MSYFFILMLYNLVYFCESFDEEQKSLSGMYSIILSSIWSGYRLVNLRELIYKGVF